MDHNGGLGPSGYTRQILFDGGPFVVIDYHPSQESKGPSPPHSLLFLCRRRIE